MDEADTNITSGMTLPLGSTDVKFSHSFSGISVWLEPDPSQTEMLLQEMDHLMQKCGGRDAGMHMFVPHCTLLYNTSFPSGARESRENRRREGEGILKRCLSEYREQCDSGSLTTDASAENETKIGMKMIPTSHYYFPYPKTADGGKGFGCAISLLILETTPQLKCLQEVVKGAFPPDERHGGGSSSNVDVCDGSSVEECNETRIEEVEFRPHMALIYAPENHENVTNGWLEDHTVAMENEKRYLIWTSPQATRQNAAVVDRKAEMSTWEKQTQYDSAGSWDAKYISSKCNAVLLVANVVTSEAALMQRRTTQFGLPRAQ